MVERYASPFWLERFAHFGNDPLACARQHCSFSHCRVTAILDGATPQANDQGGVGNRHVGYVIAVAVE